ncbi:hypothetical protein HU200_015109 [Digitaria exilis]|uniref:2'-phosphotransferase n=1 Tax=Digitaria exilis TaxID=1010633 RepID=A0A835FAD9_9POAL|nr:hypothetical protein HU200_015109 [Digitaria exilis]
MNPSSSSSSSSFSSSSDGYQSAASPHPRGRGRGSGGRWGGRGGRDGRDQIDAFGSSSPTGGYHSVASAFSSLQLSDDADTQRRGGGAGGGWRGGRGGSERIDAFGSSSISTSAGYHSSDASGSSSRVLRHMAAELGLDMRTDGYVRVRDLLRLNVRSYAEVPLKSHTVDEIREAVRRDNKGRFSLLEEDGELLIRANQGHSVTLVTSESLLKPILSADEVSDGMKLYISDNKVILTEGFDGIVPVKYFEKIETWPKRTLVPFEK